MYMCVRGISQESDQLCVMYMCVRGISQESDQLCICVLEVSVRKVISYVYVY